MTRSDHEVLQEALTHFDLMLHHAQGELTDQLVIDAVCMRLSAGLDVLNRLDPDVRDGMFGDNCPLMWGMRNRIATTTSSSSRESSAARSTPTSRPHRSDTTAPR